MKCINDIEVNGTVEDAFLRRALPEDVAGSQTTFYHLEKSIANPA